MSRQIVHGAAASVVYVAATVVAGVIQLRIVVGMLPPAIAGLWLLFLTIGSYVAWFDLGISPTVGREISFALGDHRQSDELRDARISELLVTLWSLFRVLAAGVGLVSLIVGEIILRQTAAYGGNRTACWAWAVFSLGVVFNLLGGAALAGLFGIGRVASEKLVRSAAALVGLALSVGALKLGFGILGLAVAWAIQGLVSGAVAWYQLRRRYRHFSRAVRSPNWSLARKLASPSMKLAFIQLGAILILQSADPLIAATMGTPAIPPYEAVARIATTLMTLAMLIVNSSSPFFSMAYAAGRMDQFALLLVRNLRWGLGLMVVLSAFVAVNGDRIVSVWLGPRMFAGFPVLWVLLAMVLLEVHHVVFATAVMAAGQIVFAWAALGSGVLNIVFALILAARFGLLGIAVAVALGQALTNNWYAPYYAIRFLKLSVSMLVRQVWTPMALLLAIEIGANFLLRHLPWLGGPGWLALMANSIAAVGLGAGIWSLLVLPSSDRAGIREWLHAWSAIKVEHV